MADKYVVNVAAPGEAPTAEVRQRLAELLRLDASKLDALLRRLPADVTKPVPEATALAVARRFRQGGLAASIRPYRDEDAASGVASESDLHSDVKRPPRPDYTTEAPASRLEEDPGSASEAAPEPTREEASESAAREWHETTSDTTARAARESDFGGTADQWDEPGQEKSDRKREPTDTYLRRSDQDADWASVNLWKTRSQASVDNAASRADAADDELFPPSAFTAPPGPKAPSRILVIALVTVVAVLAALWLLL